jgi:Omp85 superfamily domain
VKHQINSPLRILLLLLCFSSNTFSKGYKLIVIGNTTDISEASTFYHLKTYLAELELPYSIFLPGDINSKGKDFENLSKLKGVLLSSRAEKIIFIPGDRDWDNSGEDGWKQVRKLEKEIESWADERVLWPLNKACPGPKWIELNAHTGLVVFNSQWFNHPHEKPVSESGKCKIATLGDFMEEFEDLIDENDNKNIIVGSHFPLISHGNYGGNYSLKDWIFPIPIVSGMVTSFHQNVGNAYDISNERFHDVRYAVGNSIYQGKASIYISGHEKNQQVLSVKDKYLINSGNLEKGEFAANFGHSIISTSAGGVMVLDFQKEGGVFVEFVTETSAGFESSLKETLFQSACETLDGDKPVNQVYIPCKELESPTENVVPDQSENTKAVAGPEYKAGFLKRTFLGKHYRDTWTTEIDVPYLKLEDKFDGLTAFEKGGGRQTKSLKLKAGNGYEYVFRSVNKDPTGAIAFELRGTILASLLRDQTTTQQPYGAMAVDPLLNELGILHAHPQLYVMPDDPKLGPFREDFSLMLGMLEDRQTNTDGPNEKAFAGADKIRKSFKMFRDLYNDRDNEVETGEFVRARVFDMWVGDWGKHEDNWKWAGYKRPGSDGLRFHPIPRDRDHVFSRWDGALPWIADREWAKPSGENFGYRIKGLRSLMWQARHLDRFIANEPSREDWRNAATFIQENMNDELIESAIQNMPPETYNKSGAIIEGKLKTRLKDLPEYADSYYEILAKEVDVVGTVKKDFFQVNRNTDGTVDVKVYNLRKGKKGSKKLYDRRFYPRETREVRLFGLRGDDRFEITGKTNRSILTRIVGGTGDDNIHDDSEVKKGRKKTLVYDMEGDNIISESKEVNTVKHADPIAYHYDRTGFKYNTYFPLILFSYNADEGLLANLSFSITGQKYGKPDFSSKHEISSDITTQGNFIVEYSGRYHQVFGTWDLLLGAHVGYPNKFNYIYGIGNESVKDDDLFNQDFYRSRYNSTLVRLGVLQEFWSRSSFSINGGFEANSEQLEKNNIFDASPNLIRGEEALDILRGSIILDIDLRDRPNLSEKGMRLFMNHQSGWVLNNDDKRFHKIEGTLEQFFTSRNKKSLTLGLRVGGSAIWGNTPYYYRSYLGQLQNLRGYRKNRFTGDQSLFLNTDLRWKFAQVRTALVPFGLGLRGFVDTGRVFVNSETSDTWHTGYGLGFYIVPLKERFSLNVSLAFSEEEAGLLLFNLGKTFN